MRQWSCSCGKCFAFGSDAPSSCQVCRNCGTTMLRKPDGTFVEPTEHSWTTTITLRDGKEVSRVKRCNTCMSHASTTDTEVIVTVDALIEQLCRDLYSAHNEILKLRGCANADLVKHTWPSWSSQANSIRCAEQLLGRKLRKEDLA